MLIWDLNRVLPLIFILYNFIQVVPICRLSSQHIFIEPADLDQSLQMISKDPVEIILSGISILELCLVIAMNHIKNITGNSFNFEMVYNGMFIG